MNQTARNDTNDATMGFQYKHTRITEFRFARAIEIDMPDFMGEVGQQIKAAFGNCSLELHRPFAKAAYVLSAGCADEASVAMAADPVPCDTR